MPLFYRNSNGEDAEFAREAHSVRRRKARPHHYKGPQNTVREICVSLYLVDLEFFSNYLRHALIHGDRRQLGGLLEFNYNIMGNWRLAKLLKLICPNTKFRVTRGSIEFENTPTHWGFDSVQATNLFDAIWNQHPEMDSTFVGWQEPKLIESPDSLPTFSLTYMSDEYDKQHRIRYTDRSWR